MSLLVATAVAASTLLLAIQLAEPRWLVRVHAISIDVSNTVDYNILLPVVVDAGGRPVAELTVFDVRKGSAMITVEETVYGPALNITARGSIYAEAGSRELVNGPFPPYNTSRHPNGDVDFGMWVGTDPNPRDFDLGETWVYVDTEGSGLSITIGFGLIIGNARHAASFETSADGWHSVPVTFYTVTP